MMYHFGSSWLSCYVALFVFITGPWVFPQDIFFFGVDLFFTTLRCIIFTCHVTVFHGTFHHNSSLGDPGALMLRPAAVGQNLFHCIFIDQSLHSAEIRTVIFEYLYVPLPDCWPWERPVQSTLNWDLYHFSIICSGVHRPCISFLTVDTPSVALSAASDSH